MNRQAFRVARYRFRCTLARRLGGYLALVLLIGLIGGIAMGSVAAGRRTQSAYPKFLASTNPSDLSVSYFGVNSSSNHSTPYSAALTNGIAHLAHVKRVESVIAPNIFPLGPNGEPVLNNTAPPVPVASVDGLDFNQDRVSVALGRMASPERTDEFVATADAARVLGAHVGQVVAMGAYTSAQTTLPDFGTPRVPARLRIDAKLVGIVVVNTQVVQDDVDRFPSTSGFAIFTPALTRQMLMVTDSTATIYGLQLDRGARAVSSVEQELVRLLPPGSNYNFHVTSPVEAKIERAVKPEAIALGVFGAIAALAALAIAAQAVSRQLQAGEEDLQVLRALGATPAASALDGLVGILGAVVVGSLLAAGVAVGLSPLSPVGPVRPFYPSTGIAFDWSVLGVGMLALVVGLGAIAVALSYRDAPHRVARRSGTVVKRSSSLAQLASSSGLSAPGVVGVRFALEPGRGRTAVPVRSASVGAALAVVMVVATLTFGSGLRTLVSRPALYGWNWSYAFNTNSDAIPPQALDLLAHDPDVAAWTGVDAAIAHIDGQNVPTILADSRADPAPPMLSGHGVAANNQIVLGPATLAGLHKHIGETVIVTYGTAQNAPMYLPPAPLTIVGTATMPAFGNSTFLAPHPSMGIGALVPIGILPAAFQQARLNPDPINNGPSFVFVRLRDGIRPAAGLADMQRIADAGDKALAADPNANGNNVTVLGPQRPAEIVNYRTVGNTPVILASGLAGGAIVALGLTLASSVRRRRRDLALLKALGFTQRQLAAAVAWQASVAAVIGVVAGVPIGIAIGRQLWTLFARNIYAVPQPTVPVLSVIVVAVGALLFANVVAALPGRLAARTPTALVLRTE